MVRQIILLSKKYFSRGIFLTILAVFPADFSHADHKDLSCFGFPAEPPPKLSDWRFYSPDLKKDHKSPNLVPKEVQFLRNAVKKGFPIPKSWEKQLQGIKEDPIGHQLLTVNSLVNDIHYLRHKPGGWRYPREFIRDGGDCEDFAIAKYVLLRQLNFKADILRIVVVKAIRGARQYHMFVVVKTGDKPKDLMVLDIEHDYPRSLIYCDDFKVFLSFNEKKLWRHGSAPSGKDPREQWGGCVVG